MAAENAAQGKKGATEDAVAHYGFYGILAAGGGEAAAWGEEGRDAGLIEADGEYGEPTYHFAEELGVEGVLLRVERIRSSILRTDLTEVAWGVRISAT